MVYASMMLIMHSVIPLMKKNRFDAIIFRTSTTGRAPIYRYHAEAITTENMMSSGLLTTIDNEAPETPLLPDKPSKSTEPV